MRQIQIRESQEKAQETYKSGHKFEAREALQLLIGKLDNESNHLTNAIEDTGVGTRFVPS